MIETKMYFGWHPATKEKALIFAKMLFRDMPCGDEKKRLERINTRHVRGVSFTLEDLRE